MHPDDYTQLVKSSEVFRSLDKDFQKVILSARGDEQKRYAQIFITEKNGIMAAKKELLDRNNEVIAEMDAHIKKTKKEYLQGSEKRQRAGDEKKAEKLINSIST